MGMGTANYIEGERICLGISLGFNCSAALVSSRRGVLAAISEERLNGEKNTRQFPYKAIVEVFKTAGIMHVDDIQFCHWRPLTVNEIWRYSLKSGCLDHVFEHVDSKCTPDHALFCIVRDLLSDNGIGVMCNKMERVPHHMAHIYSAFGVYGIPDRTCISIASDGFGDGLSTKVVLHTRGYDIPLIEKDLSNSYGLVYQYFTGALGFKEHQHEGKITGLAAFGKPIYLLDLCKTMDRYREEVDSGCIHLTKDEEALFRQSMIDQFDALLLLKRMIYTFVKDHVEAGAPREDLAATVQAWAELRVTSLVEEVYDAKEVLGYPGQYDLYLSGGLFANVKLNQRIAETGEFNEVFVAPPMGDEGTALGCAVYKCRDELAGLSTYGHELSRILVGTFKVDSEIEAAISKIQGAGSRSRFSVEKVEGKDAFIDKLTDSLAQKKIVCLFTGRMEFGPRALCDRSILYDCTDPSVNKWLNEQLSRTEFMPFAPVCRAENARGLFEDFDVGKTTAKFMTMTFDCTPEMCDNYPAAVHVDNTARPQVVVQEEHPLMYSILSEYEHKTGLKVLINTSFNLHNYPIIESPETAIESWITSNTDVLAIGSYILTKTC